MGTFMQKARHKNDPKWLGGLTQHIEKADKGDIKSVVRNYGADPKPTADASYESKKDEAY